MVFGAYFFKKSLAVAVGNIFLKLDLA